MDPIPQKPSSPAINLFFGLIGGVTEVTIDHPWWTLKRRCQTEKQSTLQVVKQIIKEGSFQELYRGYRVNCLNMSSVTALQMGTTAVFLKLFNENTFWGKCAAAFSGGIASAVIGGPCEQVMTTQQLRSLSPFNAFRTGIQAYGIRYPFRGLPMTALREGIFSSAYQVWGHMIQNQLMNCCSSSQENHPLMQRLSQLFGGVVAGATSAYLTHPIDTIKTLQQSSAIKISSLEAAQAIFTENGVRGFYRGGVPRAGGIASAVCILTFVDEKMKGLYWHIINQEDA